MIYYVTYILCIYTDIYIYMYIMYICINIIYIVYILHIYIYIYIYIYIIFKLAIKHWLKKRKKGPYPSVPSVKMTNPLASYILSWILIYIYCKHVNVKFYFHSYFLNEITKKKKTRKKEQKNNILWPIINFQIHFMTHAKSLQPPTYILNVLSLRTWPGDKRLTTYLLN